MPYPRKQAKLYWNKFFFFFFFNKTTHIIRWSSFDAIHFSPQKCYPLPPYLFLKTYDLLNMYTWDPLQVPKKITAPFKAIGNNYNFIIKSELR